jgi:hypothetical protein
VGVWHEGKLTARSSIILYLLTVCVDYTELEQATKRRRLRPEILCPLSREKILFLIAPECLRYGRLHRADISDYFLARV